MFFNNFRFYNQQMLDLGISEHALGNKTEVNEYIKRLEMDFDFAMIEELFLESLVLLADNLCLPLELMAGFNRISPQVLY